MPASLLIACLSPTIDALTSEFDPFTVILVALHVLRTYEHDVDMLHGWRIGVYPFQFELILHCGSYVNTKISRQKDLSILTTLERWMIGGDR